MVEQKRGRGRPPKPPEARKRNNVTIRLRDQTKAALEHAAAENQRSFSEEAEWRLERSFDYAQLQRDFGGMVKANEEMQRLVRQSNRKAAQSMAILKVVLDRIKAAGPDAVDLIKAARPKTKEK